MPNPSVRLAIALTFVALASASCGQEPIDQGTAEATSALSSTLTIKGRLVIPDDYDCTGGTTSAYMPWTACHAFKHQIDPTTGAAITANQYVPGAQRPLSASVTVVYQPMGGPKVCDVQQTQTDDNGNFSVKVANCATNSQGVVSLTVTMQYQIKNPSNSAETLGTVRALWKRGSIPQPYVSGPENIVYSDVNGEHIIPGFGVQNLFFTLAPHSSTVNVGTQIIAGRDFPAAYQSYTRGALAAWQNTIGVHLRARSALKQSGVAAPYASYAALFPTTAWDACTACFTVGFELPGQFGGGQGGGGAFTTAAPAADITEAQVMGLSSAGVIAHEFGHGMTGMLAPGTMMTDSSISTGANADGSNDYQPHSPVAPSTVTPYTPNGVLMVQDQPEAMTEGFGDAMGRFLLLDGCNGAEPNPTPGDPNLLNAVWNPPSYDWCDANVGSGCPTHLFRWQMKVRGIAEGSAEWNRRRAALTTLAQTAANGGMKNVLSNNESRGARFFCELLASNPDYTSMAGKVKGQAYINDYPFLVSEILDGRSPAVTWRSYASDVSTSKPHVSLVHLLAALAAECPTCWTASETLPTAWWRLPAVTDGANAAYDQAWISTASPFSAQSLSAIIVANGWATKSQMNTALRATYMEELP